MEKIKRFRIFTALILVHSIFCGCTVRPTIQETIPDNNNLRSHKLAQNKNSIPEYRLGFSDVIEIKFFRNPRFNETVTIRPDGRISLEKIGELVVSGITPNQLDRVITELYGEFVIKPDVTIIVRQFGGYQVYVLGEVEAPGGYPIQRNMTVLQALAEAGGPRDTAKLKSVMILRRNQTKKVRVIKVDLIKSIKASRRSDVTQNDIFVQPYDIVFVPKTIIANIATFMRQVYDGFLPPLDLYLRAILFYN